MSKSKPNLENYYKVYKSWNWGKESARFWENCKSFNIVEKIEQFNKQNLAKKAIIWESEIGQREEIKYGELFKKINQFANLLKLLGAKKGDRVFIFLPRIPELFFAYLGILKAGCIASLMFAAFSTSGIAERIKKGKPKILVTNVDLLKRLDKKSIKSLKKIILIDGQETTDQLISYPKEIKKQDLDFQATKMSLEDPALMMFTSCTAGTPVAGIVLSHKAFVQQYWTGKWVLDLRPDDVYWCTGDPGWVTGAVYGVIVPLALQATIVFYEGRFDAKKWYELIEKNNVSVLYTAPTALRMLKAAGRIYKNYNLENLRHICSVGEALNAEIIRWSEKNFGLPVYDTYWQTETGAMVIANCKSFKIKAGSMGKPLPGIQAEIIDEKNRILGFNKEGELALKPNFPSLMTSIWGNEKMFRSYFTNGWYRTNDRAKKDPGGYFWFIGRADDVIKTAGERVGPFEVESTLIDYGKVIEAGVIGKPDPERGEIIKAFCVLRPDIKPSEKLKKELAEYVKKHLAGHAYPREIEFVKTLPKTRSGKIMRRILKAKELGLPIGDTSTLEEY